MAKKNVKKISTNSSMLWKQIFKTVNIKAIPIEYLESINIILISGNGLHIDIETLLKDNDNMHEIKEQIDSEIEKFQPHIEDILYEINTEKIINILTPLVTEMYAKVNL